MLTKPDDAWEPRRKPRPRCDDCNRFVTKDRLQTEESYWTKRLAYRCDGCCQRAYDMHIISLDAGRAWPQAENE
jgi:hypothetical protein